MAKSKSKNVTKKNTKVKKTTPSKKTKRASSQKKVVKEVPVSGNTETSETEPVVDEPVVVESAEEPVVVESAEEPVVVESTEDEEPVVVESTDESIKNKKKVKKPLTPSLTSTKNNIKVPDMPLEDNITAQISTLLTSISTLVGEIKSIQNEVKNLQKNYVKVLKDHNKTLNKKNTRIRNPSGFAKPSKISKEMATFLSLDPSEEVPRNQITKLINKYIIDNELRNDSDKRQILPNKKLSKLLNLKGDEQLSYFNLQKYMKHHFIKSDSVAS